MLNSLLKWRYFKPDYSSGKKVKPWIDGSQLRSKRAMLSVFQHPAWTEGPRAEETQQTELFWGQVTQCMVGEEALCGCFLASLKNLKTTLSSGLYKSRPLDRCGPPAIICWPPLRAQEKSMAQRGGNGFQPQVTSELCVLQVKPPPVSSTGKCRI